ncbi:hypothetical protein [Serratia liquefaciens]|uniref:hypothetical protein n=1 Tax=Serratia liquefaciens TaxID=614 RepID=UPI003EC89F02
MIKRFNPDFSLSISHELAYMRETPEGGYVAHGDYATLFSELEVVKAERDALAVDNAELKSAVTAKAYIDFIESNGWNAGVKTINGKFAGFMDPEVDFGSMTFEHAKKLIDAVETPATSAALAAIRADAMAEGAEIVASKAQVIYQERHKSGDFESAGKYLTTIKFANNIASDIREAK